MLSWLIWGFIIYSLVNFGHNPGSNYGGNRLNYPTNRNFNGSRASMPQYWNNNWRGGLW